MTAISRLGYLGFEVSDLSGLGALRGRYPRPGRLRATTRTAASPCAWTTRRSASSSIRGRATISCTPASRWTTRRRCSASPTSCPRRASPPPKAATRSRARAASPACTRWRIPTALPIELFYGPERATEPFRSSLVPSGFVTGNEGLGHVVFGTMDPQATERFYCELLGMRLSDRIEAELAPGFSLRMTFLHANPRHHTRGLRRRADAEADPSFHARGRRHGRRRARIRPLLSRPASRSPTRSACTRTIACSRSTRGRPPASTSNSAGAVARSTTRRGRWSLRSHEHLGSSSCPPLPSRGA